LNVEDLHKAVLAKAGRTTPPNALAEALWEMTTLDQQWALFGVDTSEYDISLWKPFAWAALQEEPEEWLDILGLEPGDLLTALSGFRRREWEVQGEDLQGQEPRRGS
jgi:hypothetical protein